MPELKYRKRQAPRGLSMEEYFWQRVNEDGPIPEKRPDLGPCWLWTGNISGNGYGRICYQSKIILAHNFSFVLNGGVLDPNLERDHLCDNKPCVNPDHIQQTTQIVNTLRGTSPPAKNARKTHCDKGHEITGTRMNKGIESRYCLTCNLERAELNYETKRQKKIADGTFGVRTPKTHCVRGHPLTSARSTTGVRYCNECQKERRSLKK